MHGMVEQLGDGRWRLKFSRTFDHPVDKVWKAVTEPEHLAAWFPTTIEGERAAGAPLHFTFPKGQAPPFQGKVVTYQPPSVFEFEWGPDVIRLELHPAGPATTLTLYDTLEARGKAARDAAGWHTCLDALAAGLDGRPDSRDALNEWSAVHSHYVDAFGPEASTIGPPG